LVNLDGEVPIDESSACYKDADQVISAVTSAGLARVEHRLWPLSSIKGTEERSSSKARRNRKSNEKARHTERSTARKTKGHY
jgi:tRNA-splicing ligase RtcB